MSIKTIGAVVYCREDAARTLKAAFGLAARNEAHLIGLHGEYAPVPAVSPLGAPDAGLIQTELEMGRERSDELGKIFNEMARREGASTEWRAVSGYAQEEASIVRIARGCDLIVVQQQNPDDPTPRDPGIQTLLFECGRPVLVVPYAVDVNLDFKRVLVAWNGTEPSARAVFDALPFIKAADSVEVLCVDPRGTDDKDYPVSGADIVEALARHGASVTLSGKHSGGLSAGAFIENALAEGSADLLVMGAYSQPWLKQFFFGGATRTLLETMPTATLMSR